MDTKEIISIVAKEMNRDQADVQKLLEALSVAIKDQCSELNSVSIPGFGTFEPRKRLERVVVDEATGKRTLMPPKVLLTFKMSNVLKAKFN